MENRAYAFAVGLFTLLLGAGVVVAAMWLSGQTEAQAEFSPGVLMASGLIAGGAICGVLQSIIAFKGKEGWFDLSRFLGPLSQNGSWWPMVPFLAMAAALYWVGTRNEKAASSAGDRDRQSRALPPPGCRPPPEARAPDR